MRTLTRKNLDALAEVMQTLSETEQRECVGGILYITSGGQVLGYDGGSYEMVVTNQLPGSDFTNTTDSGNFANQQDWIKQNAVLIDVGINRCNGKICGDIDYADVKQKAAAITPVPGGVGSVTTAVLMKHVIQAAGRAE